MFLPSLTQVDVHHLGDLLLHDVQSGVVRQVWEHARLQLRLRELGGRANWGVQFVRDVLQVLVQKF